MSQKLQLSIGAFSHSKSLNMRGNIAIEEKSDCARTTLPTKHRHSHIRHTGKVRVDVLLKYRSNTIYMCTQEEVTN